MFDQGDAYWWDGGKKVKPTATFEARRLDTPLDKMMRRNCRPPLADLFGPQARPVYYGAPGHRPQADDLAFDATVRAAAPFQRAAPS